MAIERTLSIIKPDATRRNLTGQINARFEAAGLRIVAQRRIQLTGAQAEGFYAVHSERPFFGSLCAFGGLTSGLGSFRCLFHCFLSFSRGRHRLFGGFGGFVGSFGGLLSALLAGHEGPADREDQT